MKLPWRNEEHDADAAGARPAGDPDQRPAEDRPGGGGRGRGKAYTPKKGRPTPKRKEVERAQGIRRGPVEPPMTAKEARARRKAEKATMSKAELKAKRARERAERREARRIADERMAAGDERYLLPRDQGPERAVVRDYVDSRRFVANIFLPFALVLLLVMLLGQAFPTLANIISLISMGLLVLLFVEGILIGRNANKLVRERFPKFTGTGFGLGFYAYSRASQPRRLRTPRPRVDVGAEV